MSTYGVEELFNLAKKESPFYRELYKSVNHFTSLESLPVIPSESFWHANTHENNQILTAPFIDGVVFKSGGTSGNPKFSYFTLQEWETFTEVFGFGLRQGGLRKGDKIANLFYAGDLYASFLFITKSIEKCQVPVIHFPISGGIDFNYMVQSLNSFSINVWAGVPTTIVKLVEYAEKNRLTVPEKILFGGESMYQDQFDYIKRVFPNVKIQSIGYASVDGGLLGFATEECLPQEHCVFTDHTIMEILDEETLQPIHDPLVPGKLYLTNLTRKLMPMIRYPVGDKAYWLSSKTKEKYRKLKILGRTEEGARIGPATVYYDDISVLLAKYHHDFQIKGLQLVTSHFDHKDQLEIKIASSFKESIDKEVLKAEIEKERGFLKSLVLEKQIHPLKISIVDMEQLEINKRTGKLKRVIDNRAKI